MSSHTADCLRGGRVLPGWGLTKEQRESSPWELDPSLLEPHKRITDPIHGDVYLNKLEVALLDTTPMQRLRRVRQLGTAHLVYPGATHTRFSHALGTHRAAQNLMDVVLDQRSERHGVRDLFIEWRDKYDDKEFDRMVGEATVLARLGGLLHDLGHIPFGHTLEDDLKFFKPHDENEVRYSSLWDDMKRDLKGSIEFPRELEEQLEPLILSKRAEGEKKQLKYKFVGDLVGNTICADLIDYLQRDHLYTGLPAGLGRRFLEGFYVTPSDHPYQPERMVIRISRGGRRRTDVVSELFKYLRYRYELTERVLFHHAKLAADVMVGKAFGLWRAALVREGLEAAFKNDPQGASRAASEAIERQVVQRGDDGLLEHMLAEAEDRVERLGSDAGDWRSLAEIVGRLQRRTLYRQIGAYTRRSSAKDVRKKCEDPDKRKEIEEVAARQANAEDDSMVALWVPRPDMSLKPAGVLVDDGSGVEIVTLEAWDRENSRRGTELIDSHYGLWALRVYADRRLDTDQEKAVLDSLKGQLAIGEWDRQPSASLNMAPRMSSDGPSESQEDSFIRTMAMYKEWRDAGRVSLRHRDLLSRITEAQRSSIEIRGEQIVLDSRNGIMRANLLLFLSDLDAQGIMTFEARESVAAAIRESPSGFEDSFSEEFISLGAERETEMEEEEAAQEAFRAAAAKTFQRGMGLS